MELQEKKKKGGGKRKAEKIKKLTASINDRGTTSVKKAQAEGELQAIRFLRASDKKKGHVDVIRTTAHANLAPGNFANLEFIDSSSKPFHDCYAVCVRRML